MADIRTMTRLMLATGGVACAIGLMVTLLYLFPDLRPGGERFIFRERDGDTFRHQPGFVRPPDGNAVLEDFIRRKDANGFRLPRMTADFYPIIALGDSYTEGGEIPWVDVLAEALDVPVRNLGWRGFGTLHEAEVMRRYAGSGHKWILIGYFEGNDLSNIQTGYEELQQTGQISIELNTDAGVDTNTDFEIVTSENYLYPLSHNINGSTFELAYISDYIWWLNVDAATYRESRNIALLRDALRDIKNLAGDACVGLVYMPTKGHIYFPYADPDGNQRYVLENALALSLDADGWLTFGEFTTQDADTLFARFDNQRDVVRETALELGLYFFDLTPAFQNAVGTSPVTYYTYDSHWNTQGHHLAGTTVAQYLQEVSECSLP